MDDYQNEKEQWDEVKVWLRENSPWIIAGILIGAAAIGGWRLYQERVERLAHEASERYQQVLQAYNRRDPARAEALVADLEKNYSGSPYIDQAHLAEARAAVEAHALDKAATALRSVMDSSRDPQLRLVARLRLARVELAQSRPDDALATLKGIEADSAFAPRAAEERGDALLAKGDRAGALAAYREASQTKSAGIVDAELLDLKMRDLASP